MKKKHKNTHNKKNVREKTFFVRLFFHVSNFDFSAADILCPPPLTRRKRGGRPVTAHQSTSCTHVFSYFEISAFFARRQLCRRKVVRCQVFFVVGRHGKTGILEKLRRGAPVHGPRGGQQKTPQGPRRFAPGRDLPDDDCSGLTQADATPSGVRHP